MIENETQYQAGCQELDKVMDELANVMQYGRPADVDPLFWQVCFQSARNHAIQLEAELSKYRVRTSRSGEVEQ